MVAVSPPVFWSEYEAALARISRHRFVNAGQRCELNIEQVERWLFCAGRESRAFPSILENLSYRAPSAEVRQVLISNLDDEYGNGNPDEAHFQHYLQLIDQLGISRQRFESYCEGSGIVEALAVADYCAHSAPAYETLGYLLINEGMTPVIYLAVKVSLGCLNPGATTRFFDLHVEVDAEHVDQLAGVLAPQDEQQLSELVSGIKLGERAMAILLDEAYGAFEVAISHDS